MMDGPSTVSFWTQFQSPQPGDDLRQWNPLFAEVLKEISYKPGYGLVLQRDQKDFKGRWYFQVRCDRPDSVTGEIAMGHGGKAYLSPRMSKSELTRLIFGLFKAYEEHECREFFKWRGRAIFGPHVDSDALWEVAERFDYR
jgi:hypothetical protein